MQSESRTVRRWVRQLACESVRRWVRRLAAEYETAAVWSLPDSAQATASAIVWLPSELVRGSVMTLAAASR